ncbi:MAG TPA: bifunctional diaminohydroxyphosphoribosylaminopyrimidine deaminase/5-amino-6-(5-phosphoribosylamino)uracil reductase RibD [Bacteroidota bacterium]|nr:bifunctional diaminohydroxyphosphoribosylaminopyrimidine deaminase/5-amino-6-(5-phosphoribosylamino)uracil reductase RibD [Bacteroidota bacterium]
MKHSQHTLDEACMRECLALARKGTGFVSPNPLVGALIVKKERVIGRGFHALFGGPHAEVRAIRSALVSTIGATLYVNLEPCNFHGKTPPCTDLIIASGIQRVVVGMRDPNPLVSGKGIAQLRRAGISVQLGILKSECEQANEFFSKYISAGTPFVAVKIAQSIDAMITGKKGTSTRITGKEARNFVHSLRAKYDAVLVGAGTVNIDNPLLTVRDVAGRNPARVIVDGNLSTSSRSRIYQTASALTILYTSSRAAKRYPARIAAYRKRGVLVCSLPSDGKGRIPLEKIIAHLGTLGIASVLVEGGAGIFEGILNANIADKMYLMIAPKILGGGIPTMRRNTAASLQKMSTAKLGDDVLIEGYLQK